MSGLFFPCNYYYTVRSDKIHLQSFAILGQLENLHARGTRVSDSEDKDEKATTLEHSTTRFMDETIII